MITIISSIVLWIALCVYTDWKMYFANSVWKKKNKDKFEKYHFIYTDNFVERYIKGFFFIFFPILLFICVLINGIKVFKNNRSIFSGEIL